MPTVPVWSGMPARSGQDDRTGPACADLDTELFFPERYGKPAAEAFVACWSCPVRVKCLAWAMEHNESGVWGGTTESQRKALRSRRSRLKCAVCRSEIIIRDGEISTCVACGVSWSTAIPGVTDQEAQPSD